MRSGCGDAIADSSRPLAPAKLRRLFQKAEAFEPHYRGTWEQMLTEARRSLVSMKWLLSPYALAYLNIAAWRGTPAAFDQPKLFSEWIPLPLCLAPT
jgi:hypothetical protein